MDKLGIKLETDEKGKFVEDDNGMLKSDEIKYSISHSKNIWICAVAKTAIGIDLQFYKDMDYAKLANRFYSNNEISFCRGAQTLFPPTLVAWKNGELSKRSLRRCAPYEACSPLQLQSNLFAIWARKEAAGKLLKTGIFRLGLPNLETCERANTGEKMNHGLYDIKLRQDFIFDGKFRGIWLSEEELFPIKTQIEKESAYKFAISICIKQKEKIESVEEIG